ncbi:hypothetical protein GGG16DRAFT_122140 [Schizophyllum commune]
MHPPRPAAAFVRNVDARPDNFDSEDENAAPPAKRPRLESPILVEEFVQGSSSGNAMCAPTYIESDEVLARRLAAEWGEIEVDVEDHGMTPSQRTRFDLDEELAQNKGKDVQKKTDDMDDPEEALRAFAETFTRTRTCTQCGKDVPSPRGHVVLNGDSNLPPSLGLLLHAPCPSCSANHCRGCFATVACPKSCKGPAKSKTCTVHVCCPDVRVIALFEALGSFDRQILNERSAAEARAAEASKGKGKHVGSVGPGGTGYGTGSRVDYDSYMSYGLLSARYSRYNVPPPQRQENMNQALAKHWDTLTVRAFQIITDLLPAPYSADPAVYDMLPHAATGHLIVLSLLPDVLASLLRNDSVTDWISRVETYRALLALLKRLADSELTARVLVGPRREMRLSCGIESWMWKDGEVLWEKNGDDFSMLPLLYEHFKKLAKQCSAFSTAVQQKNEELDDDTIAAVSLCGDIMAAKDDVDRVVKMLETSGAMVKETASASKGKAPENSKDAVERRYIEICERLAFRHIPLDDASWGISTREGLNYSNYNYNQQVQQTQRSTRRSGDTLHIAREQAALSTSLPPGIFVRVDETRNDVIKAMIAGPDGTPYAGGLYEFDIFLPLEYPRTPPLVHLRTTGGGKVRFNPNLYESGKVCLSLLGTWPGSAEEQWQPYKSTLLQVFISIQSMILIDVPYFNEPGMGAANPRNQRSIMYNRNVNVENTRLAIVGWMKSEHRYGIWRDVIKSHFLTRRDIIYEQIKQWAVAEPRMKAYSPQYSMDSLMLAYPYPSYSFSGHRRQANEVRQGGLNLVAEFERAVGDLTSWETDQDGDAD